MIQGTRDIERHGVRAVAALDRVDQMTLASASG